jgi:hypothetical protein
MIDDREALLMAERHLTNALFKCIALNLVLGTMLDIF